MRRFLLSLAVSVALASGLGLLSLAPHANLLLAGGGSAPPSLALDQHAMGTSGASNITTRTVALPGVATGAKYIVEWTYCADPSCVGSTPVAVTSVTGSLGETCTEQSLARHAETGGGNLVGGATCTATTSSGTDTFTVTFPSPVSYIMPIAVGFTGATTPDTNCIGTGDDGGVAGTIYGATSHANLLASNEAIVTFVVDMNDTPTLTVGTELDNAGSGSLGKFTAYTIGGTVGSPFTFNGTFTGVGTGYTQTMVCLE